MPRAAELLAQVALCGALASSAAAGETFEAVRRETDAGEFARALALAVAEPDVHESLRAQVWVHYLARDFEAALAAAHQGLEAAPADPWLAERAVACALWLRAPERCLRELARFEVVLERSPPETAAPLRPALEAARAATAELAGASERAAAARGRARAVSLALAVLLLAAMVHLSLPVRAPAR